MDVIGKMTTDSYELTIENIEGYAFCHLDIYKWTTSAYKQMLLDLADIREALGVPLFCSIRKEFPEVKKLVEMFGFLEIYETDASYIMEAV